MARTILRMGAVRLGLLAGVGIVWVRAAQLQLIEGEAHRSTALSQRTESVTMPAHRGAIYDRTGVTLALTQEVYHLGIAPNEFRAGRSDESVGADVSRLSVALELPPAVIEAEVAGSTYVYFHGPFTAAQVMDVEGIPGVHPEGEFARFYPDPDLARALLGSPGTNGSAPSGLERVFDSLLAGIPGRAIVLRDERGRTYESPSRPNAFPVPGADVFLTIDAELQEIVEATLLDALAEFEAIGGDVVVLSPQTGEIRALASFDSAGTARLTPFTSPYEPGSTAKIFAAASLIQNGLVHETDSVWGEAGVYEFAGRVIEDVNEVQWVTLSDVIEHSSNIGIVKFARRFDRTAQFESLRRFGFGTPTGVEFPSESRGILHAPHEWSGFTSSSLAMGYEFAVTPLQLAVAYGAIANDGLVLRPSLVRLVRGPNGEVLYRHEVEPVRQVIDATTAVELRRMLTAVVYRGATAALTSYEVAGKTGTTRRAGPGGYIPGSYHASFASMFPADDPQLVLVVKLEDPRGIYGSQTAAPLTRSMFEQILASQTAALDRGTLIREEATRDVITARPTGAPAVTVSWPRETRPATARVDSTRVPDLAGLTVRAAVATLHRT
ncbi:MAG: peptidoglycan D,D-transpeptidase FtsI family protein, partial [Gemmatimonadales bacterium]